MSSALFWATNRRAFSLQQASAGLSWDVSSVTEMIVSASISLAAWHFGQDTVCVASELERVSAMTLMEIPHGQRQNVTLLAMIASSSYFRRDCTPASRQTEVNSALIVIASSYSRESYCRTNHIQGRAHSSTPSETSRTSLQQYRHMPGLCPVSSQHQTLRQPQIRQRNKSSPNSLTGCLLMARR